MLLTVFDRYNQKRTDLSPKDNGTQVKEIQADNILTLSFTLYEHVALDVNDYVDYMGERYWLMEKYRPKQKSTVEWEYNVKLYGIESLIKRFLVLKTVDGEDEPVFTLTAPPREHVAMIVQCINDGMGDITDFKVGIVEGTENITIDYEGKYCDAALKEIAEKVGAEWWAEGQTFNVCRCEHGEEITLGYGKGLTEIDNDTADNAKFYTRLFPIGSSKNIDREEYGYSRLQLPSKARYVDVNTDKYGIIHHYEASAFADIYPRRIGVVSSVRSEEVTGEDGTPFKIYYFRDDSLNFDPNEYELSQLVKRVSFQDGSELAGQGNEEDGNYFFEVNYNSDTREFEIITIWPYDNDIQLPNDTLIPKAGDKYILWNIRMPSEYYALAEEEYLTAVEKYNEQHAIDVSRYKAPTDHVYIEDNNIDLFVGRRVRLESNKYFPEVGYRKSRITKITRKVNMPSQMDIEISDALSTGSLTKIGDDITDVKNYTKGIAGSISLPDIIRSWDKTLPTDNNLFSARRSQQEFLSKTKADRAKKKITFEEGVNFGSKRIDGQGNAQLADVTADTYKGTDGVVRLDGNTDISGDANVDKSLDVTKNLLVGGDTNISGSAEVGGDATIAGQTTTKTAKVKASLEIGDYQEGDFGYGGKMYVDENGNSHIVVDHAVFRKKAEFNEITVKELKHVGGVIVLSAASMIASRVEKVDGGWKCYFKNTDSDGNRILNEFVIGDMVRCQTFNMGDSDTTTRFLTLGETYIRVGDSLLTANSIPLNRYYWRTLTEVGTDYIVMSETDCDPSVENDEPMVGDDIVLFGSKASLKRQNVIILSAYGEDAPSRKVFQGINDYTLVDKLVYGEYFDYTTNKSKSVMYGDSYVGKRDESTYVKYTTENGVEVKGKMHIERGSTGASNLTDFGDEMINNAQKLVQGKYNLIRNSGFTGDYVTDILFESTVQNPDSEMYSPPLDHWVIGVGTATVNDSVISESGKEVALSSCSLSQTLESPLIKGENYIVSLKAKGTMNMSLNIYNNINEERNYIHFDLAESWNKYTYSFVASDSHTHITFWSSDCSMCEIQLERGNIPSAWGRSFLDNQTTLAYYKSLTYLSEAMANGSTDILGGLILTTMINLGNYKDGKLVKATAGTSGVYNDDDDVAFWAGGSLEQAISLVTKIKANPKYQPTTEEWANLAKYVVTHGGDTIMKGTVFADNGYFRGRLEAKEGYFNGEVSIADGKIQMNTDGSGHLAGGNIRWNTQGKAEFDGAVNAETLYRGICLVWDNQTYKLLSKDGNYKIPVYLLNKENVLTFIDNNLWDADDVDAIIESVNETDEGSMFYWGDNYFSNAISANWKPADVPGIKPCTGGADIVLLQNNPTTEFAEETIVYIPRAQDYVGKLIEVVNPKKNATESENYVFIHQADDAQTFVLGVGLKDGEIETFVKFSEITIGSGTTRFYSDGTYWIKL